MQSLETIERTMDRDYFMDVEVAKDFGIIDQILSRRDISTTTNGSVNSDKKVE